jgi:nitronate monooxygenase
MAGSATPALAAAVSNAGGLGSLGCADMTPATLAPAVAELRAATSRPFNLNFFVHPAPARDQALWTATRNRLLPLYVQHGLAPPPDQPPHLAEGFPAEMLDALLDLRPPVVSFHFGVPGPAAMAGLREAGIAVISTATTVAEARDLEQAGVTAIIAQGYEAGGHRGSHRPTAPGDGIGTMALVPQVVDAVTCPVIAAGGIGDGRGIAAALALGASGVQMGTAFLSCPEAATDPARRARLRTAQDTDTMVTDAVSGRSARAARSTYAVEMATARTPLPDFPSLYELVYPLCMAEPVDVSFHLYGQAAALNRELPAAALMQKLVEEAAAAMARLRPA